LPFSGRGVLSGLLIGFHEVFLVVRVCDFLRLHLAQLVVQPAALHRRDLVLRVGASDLVSPLHLFGLDDKLANLLLSVLGRCEGHNEIGAIFAIWLELALSGVDKELLGGVGGEVGCELSKLLHMVGQAERNRGGLVERRLDRYYVIHLRFEGLEDRIELPATTTTLVYDELNLSLEWSQRFKSEVEEDGLVWRGD
jgi:hypothetical protein